MEEGAHSWTAAFMTGISAARGKACLMNMVDDATSTGEAHLGDEETIWAAGRVLRQWIGKYGVLLREPTERELLHGKGSGHAVRAHVPDRLIKKMGCKKIRAHEAANEFCSSSIWRITMRGLRASQPSRRMITVRHLRHGSFEQVFCLETEPSISNDWVVRYENRHFQLERTGDYPLRQALSAAASQGDGVRMGGWADRDSL